ncbi:MAG TPA: sigma-70 family RNA polymerase sigma factor [Bryobacteraceae bacterium]|nr:sigma-70 family RNA polymerase sigma factor [Bryobacteraceae bacterium]
MRSAEPWENTVERNDAQVQNLVEDQSGGNLTQLLSAWTNGDQHALLELMPLVYRELHRIAKRRWSGQAGHTLQPTVLIHEAYLKLAGQGERSFQSRAHFFAVASMAMRQVLVNHAEACLSAKRGGGRANVPLEEADTASIRESEQVVALHQALERLYQLDQRKARMVELRYFGGMSVQETAEALGVSAVTIARDWQTTRAWLARELGSDRHKQA